MGYPMAGHLKTKGHDVTVYNRTAARAVKWVEEFGGRASSSAREAAKGQEFVFACVGNDDNLRAVTTGADGAFAGIEKPAVFVDHTTASAVVTRELDAIAKTRGLASSMPQYPAARPAPRQVRSASCAAARRTITRGPKGSSLLMREFVG